MDACKWRNTCIAVYDTACDGKGAFGKCREHYRGKENIITSVRGNCIYRKGKK